MTPGKIQKTNQILRGQRGGSPHHLRTISAPSPQVLRYIVAEKVWRRCGDRAENGGSIY